MGRMINQYYVHVTQLRLYAVEVDDHQISALGAAIVALDIGDYTMERLCWGRLSFYCFHEYQDVFCSE